MSSPQGEESAAPWAACMDAEASHPYPSRPSRIWPVPTLPRAGSTPVRVGPFRWRTFQGMATVFVMKAPTVFLGELTNSELEDWLRNSSTVIIPVGAVEQHGPHSAMLTDVIIPTESACRVVYCYGSAVP